MEKILIVLYSLGRVDRMLMWGVNVDLEWGFEDKMLINGYFIDYLKIICGGC